MSHHCRRVLEPRTLSQLSQMILTCTQPILTLTHSTHAHRHATMHTHLLHRMSKTLHLRVNRKPSSPPHLPPNIMPVPCYSYSPPHTHSNTSIPMHPIPQFTVQLYPFQLPTRRETHCPRAVYLRPTCGTWRCSRCVQRLCPHTHTPLPLPIGASLVRV